jgi:hypothetical protein
MFTNRSRKVLLAALLAASLAAPAWASDGLAIMQMAQSGQSAPDMVAMDSGPSITQEASQLPTQAILAAPRQKVSELRTSVSSTRQPSVGSGRYGFGGRAPLILGVGY